MLSVNTVRLTNTSYDGFSCAVEFQVGDRSYSTVTIELTPEATRKVVELAIAEAKAMLVVDATDIAVKGEAKAVAEDIELPAPPAFVANADDAVSSDEVVF